MKEINKYINLTALLLFAAAIMVFAFDRGVRKSEPQRGIASMPTTPAPAETK